MISGSQPSPNTTRRTIRNLVIFAGVTASCGFAGAALDRLSPPADPMQGLGVLIWLVSPLATNLLLRAFGGDGWADAGLAPRLKSSWIWYLAAILIAPLTSLAVIAAGAITGAASLDGFVQQGVGAYLPLVGQIFLAVMVKNIFEEFAWRGYLTPRFESLKLHPFASAALTGVIWASWHIPYYLYFLNPAELQAHTALSVPALIALAFLTLPLQALAYHELRLLSKTTWTAWLMHNMANAASMPLVSGGFVVLSGGLAGVLLSPGTEGVLYAVLMGAVGYGLYRYRKNAAAVK